MQCPSVEVLGKCTREQLLKIAEHYEIKLPKTVCKEVMRSTLRAQLGHVGVCQCFPLLFVPEMRLLLMRK